jgi:hypothetical protein
MKHKEADAKLAEIRERAQGGAALDAARVQTQADAFASQYARRRHNDLDLMKDAAEDAEESVTQAAVEAAILGWAIRFQNKHGDRLDRAFERWLAESGFDANDDGLVDADKVGRAREFLATQTLDDGRNALTVFEVDRPDLAVTGVERGDGQSLPEGIKVAPPVSATLQEDAGRAVGGSGPDLPTGSIFER